MLPFDGQQNCDLQIAETGHSIPYNRCISVQVVPLDCRMCAYHLRVLSGGWYSLMHLTLW